MVTLKAGRRVCPEGAPLVPVAVRARNSPGMSTCNLAKARGDG